MPEEPSSGGQIDATANEETVGGVGVIIPGNGETLSRPAPPKTVMPQETPTSAAEVVPSAAEIEAEIENGFVTDERADELPAEAALLAAANTPVAPDQDDSAPPLLVVQPVASDDGHNSHTLLAVILGGILGALLALLILLIINGSLDYSQHERILLLANDVATLQQDMDGVRAAVGKNQDGIVALENDLNELGATTATQGESIAALESQVTTLDQNLAQTSADIAASGERMGVLESEVISQGETVGEISADVGAIDEEMVGIQKILTTVDETLQQLANKDITLQEAVDTISARIAELDVTARHFDTFVDNLRQTLQQISEDDGTALAPAVTPTVAPTEPAATPSAEAPAAETPVPITTEPFTQTPTLQRFPPENPIPYPEPDQSHIFGLVYDDRNQNGIADRGDKALPGISIVLRDPSDREVATAVTGADGRYLFANVRPGFYFVVEVDAEGATSVTPNYVTISARPDRLVEVNFADRVQ